MINTTKFTGITIIFTVLGVFICSLLAYGWQTAYFITFAVFFTDVAFILLQNDPNQILGRILVFSMFAGLAEVFADAWLIKHTKTLVYAPNEQFHIHQSPLYMPFAWADILIQLGYLSHFLEIKRWFPKPISCLLMGIAGALHIFLCEYFANRAGWWYYKRIVPMIGNTPIFIVMGEFMVSFALPIVIPQIVKRQGIKKWWLNPIFSGILFGVWIWISYILGYSLFA